MKRLIITLGLLAVSVSEQSCFGDTKNVAGGGKKYELIDTGGPGFGHPLKRIKYLRDIPRYHVMAGDLGGFLESYDNLSQDGDAVVLGHAIIFQKAVVESNATVSENAVVGGSVHVTDEAEIFGHVIIENGGGRIHCNAKVSGHAVLTGALEIGCGVFILSYTNDNE